MKYRGIAISGKAAAGKDVVGAAIEDHLVMMHIGTNMKKLAAPIYAEAYSRGMVGKDRPLLQRIGDSHTQKDPTYYPRLLVEELEADDEPGFVIVTDLRKTIEAEYLRQKGFALVRLDVVPDTQRVRLLARDGIYTDDSLRHWTETDLDYYPRWDIRVPNNGDMTVEQLSLFILWALGADLGQK